MIVPRASVKSLVTQRNPGLMISQKHNYSLCLRLNTVHCYKECSQLICGRFHVHFLYVFSQALHDKMRDFHGENCTYLILEDIAPVADSYGQRTCE